ncbi:class I SAM-dependent methyltransferase [Gluconacetobacter tumulisoli]|uniref:Methyltransferase domain-containing protein n=1 Tax=Gluconacetobacter tumulisoli TaxID=1286189 RepID=A0A7W4PPQ7_9PROT|nr:methyltransferase domain-containing protein [Gluconacetobacter tumulisoli]MBB2202091.1 methyltransferase domain-containing protein [Gluconacetobacter tumulisoli]
MNRTSTGGPPKPDTSYFDRRSATYDRDEVHHRVVSLLLAAADIRPGSRVLDVATGTGILALAVAPGVGPTGQVVGVDISPGMLAEARRKAADVGVRNIDFVLADAERLHFPDRSFDQIFCASSLVLMSDIPRALRHWCDLLRPGGGIAFDTPARPFGLSQMIAESAAGHGVRLAYADVADTPGKCRRLLEAAGFEVVAVRTERAAATPVALDAAIAFWDSRLDHPAWQALRQSSPATRDAVRSDYIGRVTAAAVGGYVPNDTALNIAAGRKPA